VRIDRRQLGYIEHVFDYTRLHRRNPFGRVARYGSTAAGWPADGVHDFVQPLGIPSIKLRQYGVGAVEQ